LLVFDRGFLGRRRGQKHVDFSVGYAYTVPTLRFGSSRLALYAPTGDDIVGAIFLIAVTLLLIRGLAWNQVKALLARGWLTHQGTVEFGNVEVRRTRYKNLYLARIDYSYAVNGEYYSGYLERMFFLESSADTFVAAMKGQMVFVRSNPNRPERSALLKQDQPGGWPA
jgi:uncharacterized protein DUF3592